MNELCHTLNYVTHMNMSHLGRRVCRATTTAQHTCTLALGTLNIPQHSLVLCSADQGPCQKTYQKVNLLLRLLRTKTTAPSLYPHSFVSYKALIKGPPGKKSVRCSIYYVQSLWQPHCIPTLFFLFRAKALM